MTDVRSTDPTVYIILKRASGEKTVHEAYWRDSIVETAKAIWPQYEIESVRGTGEVDHEDPLSETTIIAMVER